MTIKERISQCLDIKGNISFKKISKELMDQIIDKTYFLNEYNPKPQERIYCIRHDITEIPICPLTNKKKRFSPQIKAYTNTFEYAQKNKIVSNKFDFVSKNAQLLNELKELYNSNGYKLLSKQECCDFFDLYITTNSHRFTIEKLLKYLDFACSVIYYTNFLNSDNISMSERVYCIKHNITELLISEYGEPLKFINRYVGYSKHASKKERYKYQLAHIKDQIEKTFEVIDFIKEPDTNTIDRVEVRCKACDYTFKPLFRNKLWSQILCPVCNGFAGRSKQEDEIVAYLKTLGIQNIVLNDRSILDGAELDIFLPDYNIAIEYNGIIWHSFGTTFPNNNAEEHIKKYNHYTKYEKCLQKGIKLLTIFDNEWIYKQDIIKSIISNKLNKTVNKIYARQCQYGDVDKKIAKNFLNDNHLQGSCNFSKAVGLFYNSELVSLMCFGKRKLTRGESAYELIRFCNKTHTQIIGGASKILKNSKVLKCISYCDLRYSNGELYNQLGMTLISKSKPNYYYTPDNINLFHRMNFQKHTLIKEQSDHFKTERELMYERGYRRIYDCGNLVFLYECKS